MWNEIYCTKLQLPPEPLTRGLPPPDPRSLCPLSSTEFVEPPRRKKNPWVRHCTSGNAWRIHDRMSEPTVERTYMYAVRVSLVQAPGCDGSYSCSYRRRLILPSRWKRVFSEIKDHWLQLRGLPKLFSRRHTDWAAAHTRVRKAVPNIKGCWPNKVTTSYLWYVT